MRLPAPMLGVFMWQLLKRQAYSGEDQTVCKTYPEGTVSSTGSSLQRGRDISSDNPAETLKDIIACELSLRCILSNHPSWVNLLGGQPMLLDAESLTETSSSDSRR